jgi:RHS repeat-associated protein
MWGLDLSGSVQGAGGVGGLLEVNDSANGAHFAAYDGNGNVAALVKGTDGTISAQYEYGPFAEPIRVTGPMGKTNPIRFSCKYTDEESDFLNYGHRYYNPSTGRWLSRDPMEEIGGLNLFMFADNDPVRRFDALGLAGRTADLGAKFTSYLEWFPEQGVGELKVIDPRGTEIMRFRYANGTLTPVTEHGGRPLKGLSKRALEKIAPKLNQHLKTIVERAGGRWVAEMGVRPPPRGGGGAAVRGVGFWLLVASLVLEGTTADAAQLPQPIIIPVSLDDAGLTSEMFTEGDQAGKVEESVQSRRVNQSGEISACKRSFKIHSVQSGDTCWCLWQRRTNRSITWGQAHSECAETCKSGNADRLEVGEDICIPE